MKRIFVSILAILYLSTSLGASINLHYCMGKLVDSSLFADNSSSCPKCGMEKNDEEQDGCCRDEHKEIKVQDDHKNAALILYEIQALGTALPQPNYELPNVFVPSIILQNPLSHAPPRHGKVDTYILNRNFRI